MILNNLFVINDDGTTTRTGSYYYDATAFGFNDLFKKDKKGTSDSLQGFNLEVLPVIKRNQFNKYIRERKTFLIKAEYKAWDKKQIEYANSDDYDLYISSSDILSAEENINKSEYIKGKTDISKNIIYTLKNNYFIGRAYNLKLFKNYNEVPQILKEKITILESNLEATRYYWNSKGQKHIIKAYEEAIAAGFKYAVVYPSKEKTNVLIAHHGVIKTETTPEYEYMQMIESIINDVLYNKTISDHELIELMKKLNITIKE